MAVHHFIWYQQKEALTRCPFDNVYISPYFYQICTPAGMECIRKRTSSSCGVACQGLYADVTKRYVEKPPLVIKSQFLLIFSREVTDEKEQSDAEKLMTMKQEYERYKDLWGLNIHYSHSAGPTQNYSELVVSYKISAFLFCS